MRYTLLFALALMLLAVAADAGFSQATATQQVSLSVSPVSKISVSGNPGPLTISNGTAGTDALTPVSNSATTYSITHNSNTDLQITASLDQDLPSGYVLEVSLASNKGSGGSSIDISSTTPVSVVTAIAKGADAGRTITYTFSADASAGPLSPITRTVTLTLTN